MQRQQETWRFPRSRILLWRSLLQKVTFAEVIQPINFHVKPISLVLLSALALSSSLSAAAFDKAPRPNILLILADDLGYADVGFNGSPDIVTPEMDKLAKGGTIFSQAYAVHPFCGPSRMGLLSGRYPHEFGAPYNLPDHASGLWREQGIPESETLISSVLKESGYHTGIMGKWHLGQAEKYHPNKRGFDDFYGFLGGGILFFGPYQKQNEAGKVWDYKVFPEHNGTDDTSLTENDYMTDVLTEKGVNFIKASAEKKDEPFFLFMSYNAPHTVLAAKEDDMAHFPDLTGKRKTYAGMVYAMDRGIGELVEALKETEQYENTLIIFTSDNGGRTDEGATNTPLTGVKGDVTEGGYRVPMFFHWPETVPAGKTYNFPISALDFYPSFARLAGAEIPDGKDIDGKDIWDDFLEDRSPRKGEMFYTVRHKAGYSDVGARIDQWKIVRANMRPWQLFNIDEDISEKNDLSAKHPERLQQMISEAEKMTRNHTEPLWFDNKQGEEKWKSSSMPNHDKLYQAQ